MKQLGTIPPHELMRRIRKSRGMTQRQVSHASGLSGGAIGQIEAGQRDPGAKVAVAIESFLGVPVELWENLPYLRELLSMRGLQTSTAMAYRRALDELEGRQRPAPADETSDDRAVAAG